MFLLFFPFLFLTTSYVPQEPAHGLAEDGRGVEPGDVSARGTALARHRSDGTSATSAQALLAVAIVGALSMTLCFAALRGRIRRG